MAAPLSVIIPTLNTEQQLVACLDALFEGVAAGLIRELILTDGGSDDNTQLIAEEAGAIWLEGPASRGGQLRRGIAAARAEWYLVLHADTVLGAGWSAVVSSAIQNGRTGYGRLQFDSPKRVARWVEAWVRLRSRWLRLPFGDQGLLVSKQVYEHAGGYLDIPLMEDVALARSLRGKLVPLSFTALTSAGRYQKRGWVRQGCKNLTLQIRYFLGANPHVLARSYRKV